MLDHHMSKVFPSGHRVPVVRQIYPVEMLESAGEEEVEPERDTQASNDLPRASDLSCEVPSTV